MGPGKSFLFSISASLFVGFSFFLTAEAAKPLDIIINEIAWMGTDISANDEWIELYNNTKDSISLDGWVLKSEDGTPEIKLTGIILANSFFLLERTDDNTVLEIVADLIYKGALGNNGKNLKLYDNLGNLIDGVNCSSGWFAGDNKTKQTMERENAQISGNEETNWQTSQNPGGTPKAKNSGGAEIFTQPPKEIDTAETLPKTQSESSQVVSSSGVVINEILPSPEGSDEKEEWIEIFNQNSFEVDLSGWQISDALGKTKTYTFAEKTIILAKSFLVLPRPETKITLNNDGDGLILTSANGDIIDEVNYEKAPQGESYNRIDSGWAWSPDLTPGATNIISSPETESIEKESLSEVKEKGGLATIGEQVSQSPRFFLVLLIALSVAFFSGAIILILKMKLKKLYNKNV